MHSGCWKFIIHTGQSDCGQHQIKTTEIWVSNCIFTSCECVGRTKEAQRALYRPKLDNLFIKDALLTHKNRLTTLQQTKDSGARAASSVRVHIFCVFASCCKCKP